MKYVLLLGNKSKKKIGFFDRGLKFLFFNFGEGGGGRIIFLLFLMNMFFILKKILC